MTDYTKSTNFLAKDSLPETDSGKIIKGSEFDTEFNALQTSIATKADKASPTFTGIPAAPTASAGTNTTQLATTEFVTAANTAILAANNTFTGTQTFKDNKFEVVDDSDATKKLNLQLSGITTATTRTLTVPDKNGTIAVTSDISLADPLNATSNSVVSGSYAVTSSTSITITATNTYTAGQTVYIQFTNSSGSSLTNGNFSVVSATGSSFTITYGSSVTSAGTCIVTRYGSIALATSDDLSARTDTLRAVTSSNLTLSRATAQASTSGTSIDFTGIPSWAKRITIMLAGVSTNGSSDLLVQLGSGSTPTYVTSSIYAGGVSNYNSTSYLPFTTGFLVSRGVDATYLFSGQIIINNISSNTWVESSAIFVSNNNAGAWGAGSVPVGALLTAIRLTTVTGTSTFDAGTVNIIYE